MAETSTAAERSMGTDIISTLPNPLLCHILSFLPTIDAVGTSVLSRRWRHLWKDLQVFDFHDERIRDRERFVSFVESVLSRRSYPDIQKFSLRCYSLDDLNALKRWIRDVLGPCLQEMELNFYDYKTRNGIDAIFTCASLVSLSLVGHFYMNDIPAVHLPLLKNLELAAPGVPVDSKLISGCPALEDLYFIYSGRFNPKINLLSASLKRLRLIEARNFDYLEISEIQIDAPNLEFLRIYLEDSCVRTLAVSDFPNMNEASFDIYPKPEHVDWLPKLLQALSQTKKLGLGGFSTQVAYQCHNPLLIITFAYSMMLLCYISHSAWLKLRIYTYQNLAA
ncbi:hypothetical protein PIB30_117592 [Stylosanthes scabra]|uniref:F-box domain-containing protein n=1 Tax=Stylosanthes scabra TaxID=79078 RepID=A0ABU6WUW6_9FABA|nr:hypothetical protein [Stylosanthes scabra]